MASTEHNTAFQRSSVLTKISNGIEHALESVFYKLGYTVGAHPCWTIFIMLAVAGLCMVGLLRFQQESRSSKLWVPRNADALDHKEWVDRVYPSAARVSSFIITPTEGTNALTPPVLQELYGLHKLVVKIAARGSPFFGKYQTSWEKLCFRRNPKHCWTDSILSLWEFDKERIFNLTESDILSKLNKANLSDSWNGGMFPINQTIGGVTYDSSGHIMNARALQTIYRIYSNESFDEDLGAVEDPRADDFESQTDAIGQRNFQAFHLSVSTRYGFSEESGKAIQNDLAVLAGGYILIIFYVCLNLGQVTRLKHKIWLSIGGVVSAGLGIGVSFGLCSAFGLFYGPVHTILPFLLLGVGVDDMFVIVSSWENLPEKAHKKNIAERIGLTLKEAGVSVTVTSLTDLVAFLVGSTTILPALRSFCVFAGIGILFDLVFQVTFFTALLAVDGMREDALRDACCCCQLTETYSEAKCCWIWWPFKSGWLKKFFGDVYAPTLMKMPVKILVIVASLAIFSVGTYGLTLLERHFDIKWFLPSDSYVLNYFSDQDQYFPSVGIQTAVYTGNVSYYTERDKLYKLGEDFQNNKYINPSSVDYWYFGYETWQKKNSIPRPENETAFCSALHLFLNTADGQRYQSDVKFENGSDRIKATRLIARHWKLNNTDEQVDAMVSVRRTVDSVDLYPEKPFTYATAYVRWEVNLVIREELLRNLGLAMLCVFLVTFLLIANMWTSLLVLSCVVLTLVNIAGIMHFWGLTIDVVSSITLILSIGLAVDYSAHIGHAFMIPNAATRTRNDRTILTVRTIGTAVWNGGFSTFLAFVLLAGSGSYVFRTFFKVFFLVVVFGLFHGLCLLPVALSLVGPAPYSYKPHLSEQDPRVEPELTTGLNDSTKKTGDHDSNDSADGQSALSLEKGVSTLSRDIYVYTTSV